MPRRIAALALDEHQTYPVLYHYLLAAVPLAWLRRVPALPSALLDVLLATVTGAVAAEVAPLVGVNQDRAAFLAALLVACSPALLAPGIGPRAYEITPRPLGELLFAAAAASAGMYHATSAPWWAVASAVVFALALLGSKFTAQVIVFVLPVMALSVGDLRVLAIGASAIPLALVLSGGSYWWVLKGQLAHLKLYRQRLQWDHPAIQPRRARGLVGPVHEAWAAGLKDGSANRRAAMAFDASPTVQFVLRQVSGSAGVFVAFGLALQDSRIADAAWSTWLFAWLLAPIIPFLLASRPRLLFLGEAERYLEYSVLPAAVITALVVLRSSSWLGAALLCVWLGAAAAAVVYQYLRTQRVGGRSGLDGLVEHLATYPPGQRVLPIPSVNLAFDLAWRCDHRFLVAMDTLVWARDYDRLFVKYPWPSVDLEWWRTTHHPALAVIAKAWLEPSRGCSWQYGLGDLLKSFDNDGYAVYQFPSTTVHLDGSTQRNADG